VRAELQKKKTPAEYVKMLRIGFVRAFIMLGKDGTLLTKNTSINF